LSVSVRGCLERDPSHDAQASGRGGHHGADAARACFSDAAINGVTQRYGVRPDVTFVDVAELVDNAAR
jgi:hypothetical protein